MLVAKNFWIFWALTGPLSLAVFCTYFYLCYVRGSSPRLWETRVAMERRQDILIMNITVLRNYVVVDEDKGNH